MRLRSGEYGRPLEFIVYGGQHFPTYRPAYRDTYYRSHDAGGGAIQDALTHLFKMSGCGLWDRWKKSSSMQTTKYSTGYKSRIRFMCWPGIKTESWQLCVESTSASQRNDRHDRLRTRAIAVGKSSAALASLYCAGHRLAGFLSTHTFGSRRIIYSPGADSFFNAIEGKAVPLSDLRDGLQTLRVNVAAIASWRTGQWQSIDNYRKGS
ncbi:MAG: hypothetical protein R3C56_00170 [Pirellulaceae bacterium]